VNIRREIASIADGAADQAGVDPKHTARRRRPTAVRVGACLSALACVVLHADPALTLTALVVVAALAIAPAGAPSASRRRPRRGDGTDELTMLANRRGFLDEIDRAIAAGDAPLAVLLIDLDGFKGLNDSLGHEAGDGLLRLVAERFRVCVRGQAVLGRLGGDEFGVLAHVSDLEAGVSLSAALGRTFREPFEVLGLSVRMSASSGLALMPAHGSTSAELLRCADSAMYEAKRRQQRSWVYRSEDDPHSTTRLDLIDELRDAIRHRRLEMHYQPAIDLLSGEIVGVEALVRWNHPTRGLLMPDSFVPLAERVGLITGLTRAVLEQSVRFVAAAVQPAHTSSLRLSVNISGQDLADHSFPGYVLDVLIAHRFPAERLTLEITETSVGNDPEQARRTIQNIREHGIRVAIDDFGVGYSSMSQLLATTVDELKIDRSFVQPLASDPRAKAIIRSTVELARALGLLVVAEGVESDVVQEQLAALGCDLAQGYSIARPLAPEALLKRLGLRVGSRGRGRSGGVDRSGVVSRSGACTARERGRLRARRRPLLGTEPGEAVERPVGCGAHRFAIRRLDLREHLFAMDGDRTRCADAQADLIAADVEDRDYDVSADHDALVRLSGQDQHRGASRVAVTATVSVALVLAVPLVMRPPAADGACSTPP
jgi:diguanylate cyclase (GGDEF)-like protein